MFHKMRIVIRRHTPDKAAQWSWIPGPPARPGWPGFFIDKSRLSIYICSFIFHDDPILKEFKYSHEIAIR
jgi:hypothetical protein